VVGGNMTLDKAKKIIKSECYIADLLNLDRTRMVNTALDTVIKVAEQTRWIPVSEKPQKGRYLCTYENYDGRCVDFGLFDGEEWYIKPIAYMPLPQPYKAKKAVDIMNDVINAENIPYEGTDDR
jgi:hypothetical protein